MTTYAENIGVMAATRIYSTAVFVAAALIALLLGFSPKFGAVIQAIPLPVMGGVMILLFGTIASLGLKTVIDAKVDLMQPKNLVIVSAVLTTGVGGMVIKFGSMSFAGVGLCAILAIVLNMVLPKEAPNKILNEEV